ncbi:hypothetical protein ACHAXR_003846 [Thalassiosira sp. AJA248-18]
MSSLRLALKLSLESSQVDEVSEPSNNTIMAMAKRPIRRRITAPIRVELPEIDKCIRNTNPAKIDEFGFAEISRALPKSLIKQIHNQAVEKVARHKENEKSDSPKRKKQQQDVEEISNALQTDISDDLLKKVSTAMYDCDSARNAMQAVFGKKGPTGKTNYNGFVLETPKVLITEPGSPPQIPHADDHCSSCVVGLVHLLDDQIPTRIAKYEGADKDFATGISCWCDNDKCNRQEQLPDSEFRRGVHLTDEAWFCDCSSAPKPYDFEGKLTKSFGELLERNAPNLCDSYAGKRNLVAGDGLLGLPMLIHRGPGNPTDAKASRYILFFTLRPIYKNMKVRVTKHHTYNPTLQIHAPCILYNQFKKVKSIYESSGCSLEAYFSAIVGSDAGSIMRENAQLKKEMKQKEVKELKEKVAKRSRGGDVTAEDEQN